MCKQTQHDWKESNNNISKMYQQIIYKEAYKNAIKVPYVIIKENIGLTLYIEKNNNSNI